MFPRLFLFLVLLLVVPDWTVEARPVGTRPNVVLIVTDDQGWGDLGIHGNPKIETPHLDALAKSGIQLERFYVCPNCAPTRASLLTGRYHYRTGVSSTSRGEEVMHGHEVTIAEVLRESGYATGCFGKWHNGSNWPNHPNGQGFDEFIGICQGHWNRYFDAVLEHNGQSHPTEGFVTDVLTNEAIRFIGEQEKSDHPFFCYLAYNTPHSPFQAPKSLFDKYQAAGLDEKTSAVYAMVESIDANVGKLVAHLEESGLAENTIVWFLSDNGPAIRKKKSADSRYNGNFYGAKGSVHEGGVRVPSFVRWNGGIPEGSSLDRITAHIDVLPTLIDLCGIEKADTLPLDGMSLGPALRIGGRPEKWPNRILFTSWTPPDYDVGNASVAVRTDRWLAVRDARWRRGEPSELHNGWELYDLGADPFQRFDLGEDHRFLLADMRADFSRWMDHTTDSGLGPIPTEIGHAEWPTVTLQAQDARIPDEWKIKKRGNNSWLGDWKSPDWTAAWPLEVVNAGRYEVTVEYGLAETHAPCRMQLSSGDSALEFSIDDAFDSKPLPSNDLVPRGELPEKAWSRLTVGEIELREGIFDLVLQPTELTDGEAIELKSLILTRKQPD